MSKIKWHSGPPPHVDIETLRERLSYDPDTGILRWKSGKEAGSFNGNGYRRLMLNNRNLYVHRVAWAMTHGEWPEQIDHINGDRADNRLCNLRAVNNLQNCHNNHVQRKTNTGHPNIYFDRRYGTFRVSLHDNKTPLYKTFKTLDAAIAFQSRERERIRAKHYWPPGARVPRVDPR